MAKYVIELDDEPCMRENGYNFYTCKTVPWWSISDMIINRLTPYTDPDLNPLVDEAVETIENEVWEFAREISTIIYQDYMKCFGIDDLMEGSAFTKYSYREAKAKYEEWRSRLVTINNKKYKIVKEGDGKCILEEI